MKRAYPPSFLQFHEVSSHEYGMNVSSNGTLERAHSTTCYIDHIHVALMLEGKARTLAQLRTSANPPALYLALTSAPLTHKC